MKIMGTILKGLLYINDKDVYEEYGAFLTEEREGEFSNYEELLKPPAMKAYTAVAFREEDGEELPDVLPSPRFEARDVTLYFALVASTPTEWLQKYALFVAFLKAGWLNINVRELGKTYKMYYKQCSQYTQVTPLENGKEVAAKLKVLLREPKPVVG